MSELHKYSVESWTSFIISSGIGFEKFSIQFLNDKNISEGKMADTGLFFFFFLFLFLFVCLFFIILI